jgi:hypothetical protein
MTPNAKAIAKNGLPPANTSSIAIPELQDKDGSSHPEKWLATPKPHKWNPPAGAEAAEPGLKPHKEPLAGVKAPDPLAALDEGAGVLHHQW